MCIRDRYMGIMKDQLSNEAKFEEGEPDMKGEEDLRMNEKAAEGVQSLGEKEKMRVKIAQKSTELAKLATEKLKQEQDRFQSLLKEKEYTWKTQLEALQIENKVLLGKSAQQCPGGDKDKFYNNLRTQLIEEIERLERSHKQREDELLVDNNNLQVEIDTLKKSLHESKKRESDLESDSRKELTSLKNKYENALNELTSELNEEKAKSNHYLHTLNDSKNELKKMQEKEEEFNKEKMEQILGAQQREFEKEKAKVYKALKDLESLNEEKLAENSSAFKLIETQLTEETKIIEKKYRTAINEKKAIEVQFKALLDTSKEKEETITSQCTTLDKAIMGLLNVGNEKEQHVRLLVTALTKELLSLQKVFEERESDLIEDVKKIKEERKSVETLLEKIQKDVGATISPPEFASIYEAQKKELEISLSKLEAKSKELAVLKDKEITSFNGPRKAITSAVESLQAFIKKAKVAEEKLKVELKQLSAAISSANESHTSEEQKSTMDISNLNEELKKVKNELRSRDSLRYEEKMAELQTAYLKVQQELEGSKKILLTHIDTINALEDRIKFKRFFRTIRQRR
eukprot:TRINITY_DN1244_c0_g1_i2.p1 TRINITY_DN1244_c0_g1~~TRINITY_DN1244_c0_g1_i2.p1  ORF type:complete len:574 (+),score=206.76 TRINITY_DN1244_c0_g1_i2:67-1788(+)